MVHVTKAAIGPTVKESVGSTFPVDTCGNCGHDEGKHWSPGGCHFNGSAASCRCAFANAE